MRKKWKKIKKYEYLWKKGKESVQLSVGWDKYDKNPLYRVIVSDGKVNRWTDYALKKEALKFAKEYMKLRKIV